MKGECCADVLIVGGGAAAVRAAIEAVASGVSVTLVDKGVPGKSGTSPLGLHGMASTFNPATTPAKLVEDVVREGAYVNDINLVRAAAESSAEQVLDLVGIGVSFARKEDGSYHFYRGTGHSLEYGLTFSEHLSGASFVEILLAEARRRGVAIIENTMVLDLVRNGDRLAGVVVVDLDGNVKFLPAAAVVLAAGGANRLYPNPAPRIAAPMYRTTGDAYAMALRAGLELIDMEFSNFRETPPAARIGRYVNSEGEFFMTKYDSRGERASRGKIVEALYRELQRGAGPITIELNVDAEENVRILTDEYRDYVRAKHEGRNPSVSITFQRLLGGIRIGVDGSTSIRGLYAAGESVGGFHGADRLQGMAFLETQVFGARAGRAAARFAALNPCALTGNTGSDHVARLSRALSRAPRYDASLLCEQLRQNAWAHAGIVKDEPGLLAGLNCVREIRLKAENCRGEGPFDALEVQNLALTAESVIVASLARRESRGTHRRSDYPETNSTYHRKHVAVYLSRNGQVESALIPSNE